MLEINDLHGSIEGKEILKGVNLKVPDGKIIVVMGPNGSGKSTLSNIIMGNTSYEANGSIKFDGEEISKFESNKRAEKGIFMSFQNPIEIPGVTVSNLIRATKEDDIDYSEFAKELQDTLEKLGLDKSFAHRYVNVGFSGGEKKRLEMVQMLMMKPKLAILDETDSGLDVDALKVVAEAVNSLRSTSFLIITHYSRVLDLIKPDEICILMDGKIVKKGGPELANELEEKGYDFVKQKTS